jgi:DNA-binding LytR/AlgR family response regulator
MVNVAKVRALKKSGDGAVLEVGSGNPRTIPVSRNNYADLKMRLGLQAKLRSHATKVKAS